MGRCWRAAARLVLIDCFPWPDIYNEDAEYGCLDVKDHAVLPDAQAKERGIDQPGNVPIGIRPQGIHLRRDPSSDLSVELPHGPDGGNPTR